MNYLSRDRRMHWAPITVTGKKEVSAEQKVWLHVLLQAQEEAAGMHLYTKSRGETKQDVQRAAIEFLTEDSQDFRDVCSNAGYSVQQCREMVEKGKKKWLLRK